MATYLYRLGRWAFRHRTTVLVGWLVVLIAFVVLAAGFGRTADAQISIPGVEAVEASNLLQERFPSDGAGGATARVVVQAPVGKTLTDPAVKTALQETLAEIAKAPEVGQVSDPYAGAGISADGSTGYATVNYTVAIDGITDAARQGLLDSAKPAEAAGLTVNFGGEATKAIAASGATEGIGVLIALLVLAITFGSMLAAGLPLLTALFGVGIGAAGIFALSSVVDLTATTPILGVMIGLAVGIDYALFITVRHKQQLRAGMAPEESAGQSVGTAGSAVVFAGATVVIALAGLSVVGIPFLTTLGLAAAGMVAVAVVVALTLVPALLGFAGARFNRWPVPGLKRRQAALNVAAREPMGARWAQWIGKRPMLVGIGAIVGLLIIALPALDLRLGNPDDGNLGTQTTQRQAYDALAAGFGPGFNGPLVVVVDGSTAPDPQTAAAATAEKIKSLDDVVAVSPPVFNKAGNTAIINVIPAGAPGDESTVDLVNAIRDLRPALTASTGSNLLVTGNTAANIDVSAKLLGALPIFLIVIVGLALILLMLAFRSLWVPIKATLGFLLSLAATFGALVAVFQWGWLADFLGVASTGPILSFLPILLVGLLFGLAMDYELFLVSRMREDHVHGADSHDAVVGGFRSGARVVTAAALIMGSVFAGFILGDDATIKSIGFALAFGVLIDAFVVRMTIVPAVMFLLGKRAWYLPRWLDRILPNVDIEGAALDKNSTAPSEGGGDPEEQELARV